MIIDVSGFSFTGKSAFYELLSNAPELSSFGVEVEIDLLRVQGGLIDLHHALCINWSPIRSSEAIRRFSKLVHYLGGRRKIWDRFFRYGPHYDEFLSEFTSESEIFLKNLILATWEGEWPFAAFNESHSFSMAKKYLRKFGLSRLEEIYLSSVDSDDFKECSRAYISKIFSLGKVGCAGVLINNCFEPFNPIFGMEFFPEARSIVVDRDPRDIYISASNNRIINGVDVGGAVVGGDVNAFIARFLTYRKNISIACSEQLHRTRFENLVLNFDQEIVALKKLIYPLRLDWEKLENSFNRERSLKNIQQWRLDQNKKYNKDIKLIESRLCEYCMDFN